MPPTNYTGWRKSSRSGGNNGNCVEVGFADDARGIRDTKDRSYGTLHVSSERFAAFVSAVKTGQLDLS